MQARVSSATSVLATKRYQNLQDGLTVIYRFKNKIETIVFRNLQKCWCFFPSVIDLFLQKYSNPLAPPTFRGFSIIWVCFLIMGILSLPSQLISLCWTVLTVSCHFWKNFVGPLRPNLICCATYFYWYVKSRACWPQTKPPHYFTTMNCYCDGVF